MTLFKVLQLRNYSLKKFNISISDALNVQFSIKIYYLKSLKSVLRTLVNIFHNLYQQESEYYRRCSKENVASIIHLINHLKHFDEIT